MSMKVRILGTGSKKYLDNYMKLMNSSGKMLVLDEGTKFKIIDKLTSEILFTFDSFPTRKQNLEFWELLGLIKNEIGIFSIKKVSSFDDLISFYKVSLLNNNGNDPILNIRSLAILYESHLLTEEDIKQISPVQIKGEFNTSKLKKEFGEIEKIIAKDEIFLEKLRNEIKNEIN